MKTTVAASLGLLLAAGSASAAIMVTNTQTGIFNPSTNAPVGSFTIPYTVANPNSVVVAAFYFDGGGGSTATLGFGTGAGDQTASGILNGARNTMGYFLNPSTGAGLSIYGATPNLGVTNAGFVIWELSGVDLSAPVASVIGTDGATQITTTLPNSLILDSLGFNLPCSVENLVPLAKPALRADA